LSDSVLPSICESASYTHGSCSSDLIEHHDLGKLGDDESPRGGIGEEGRGFRYSNADISRSNVLHRGKELMALVTEDLGGIAICLNNRCDV
ncbi:hypothetical protein HID58_056485, partial [Brassica napus]